MIEISASLRSDFIHIAGTAIHIAPECTIHITGIRTQSPDPRFASLMDMDFAVRCPLVRRSRLISGSCPSPRTFALRFFRTPPRDGSPCVLLTLHRHQVGWKDLHLLTAEHAQLTTKPLARRTLPRARPQHCCPCKVWVTRRLL